MTRSPARHRLHSTTILLVATGLLLSCGQASEVRRDPPSGWSRAAPLPVPRLGAGVASLDGRIWVVGGLTADRRTSPRVDVYDSRSGEWRAGPPLPVPVHHPAVVAADGTVWSIGGHRGVPFRPVAYVFALDPIEGRWRAAEPLPSARGALAAAVVDGTIYAIGGQSEDETAVGSVERYDPEDGRRSIRYLSR
ncbi:MAG: kelch repeat-containing protein [Gemmatimonadota bacterium]|nr:kelch repeat-containing protein [Gemmatimonadota bacterium]